MDKPAQYSWARKLLADHPALFVSGLYLIASLIGLVHSWAFFDAFGINVFRYAEISDFLLASLKEPFTWVLTVLAVAMLLFDNAMSRRVQAKNPGPLFRWYGAERYRQINYLVGLLIVTIFLLSYATRQERGIRAGEGQFVTVQLTDESKPERLILLGTTGKFLFLYDHVDERVDIHPHESILTLAKSAPARR